MSANAATTTRRVSFCGVIEGSVTVRDGESELDAMLRAEAQINDLLERSARSLKRVEDNGSAGPVVGLELA